MNLQVSLTVVLALLATAVLGQDYDYVRPDSLPDVEKRSTTTLPIKPREPQPVYFVPSYMANQGQGQDIEDVNEEEGDQNELKTKQKRTSVQLEVGTSVSTDFKGNSAITTYAAPQVSHRINENLTITGGVIMSQTFLNGWKDYSFEGNPLPSTIYSNTVFGRLDYKVNERMYVYGAVYSNLTSTPGFGLGQQRQGQGYMVGMKYKVSKRSFIQIQVSRSSGSGYNPFMPYSPHGGYGGRGYGYGGGYGFRGSPFSHFP